MWNVRNTIVCTSYLSTHSIIGVDLLSIKGSSMSSPDSTKKRRVATGNNSGGGVDNNGLDDDGITMSTILAKLNDMQNEMNGMRSRLSRMDELEKKYHRQEDKCTALETKCNTLEKKCTHLDARCESLQRSVQILGQESTWEYSAPPVPLSHWRGLPENHIDQMQKLLTDIYEYTSDLRGDEQLGNICLGRPYSDILLQHDDILLPHWRELANALQLYNMDRRSLRIANLQLTSSVMNLLASALKGKAINGLTLDNNEFEDIHIVIESINKMGELESFELINNQIIDTKEASDLVGAIINHSSIGDVRLENCLGDGISSSYEVLCPLFASDTRWDQLDLEGNNIQTEGDTAIPDYIASNPPLKSLFLAGNKLNDDDAILIAQSLKQNNNLIQLRLDGNNFTSIGRDALSKAIYDPTSLNSMSDCNHTCQLELDGHMRNDGAEKPQIKRSTKIYQLLFERNKEGSNVQHLNAEFEDEEEDSLKLVPKVLERVHLNYDSMIQNAEDDDSDSEEEINSSPSYPLSIIYEVLRGWKMPELYEKRS